MRVVETTNAQGEPVTVEVVDLPRDVALQSLNYLSSANAAINIIMATYATTGNIMMISVDVPEDVACTCIMTFALEEEDATNNLTRFVLPVFTTRPRPVVAVGRTITLIKVMNTENGTPMLLTSPPKEWDGQIPT